MHKSFRCSSLFAYVNQFWTILYYWCFDSSSSIPSTFSYRYPTHSFLLSLLLSLYSASFSFRSSFVSFTYTCSCTVLSFLNYFMCFSFLFSLCRFLPLLVSLMVIFVRGYAVPVQLVTLVLHVHRN